MSECKNVKMSEREKDKAKGTGRGRFGERENTLTVLVFRNGVFKMLSR